MSTPRATSDARRGQERAGDGEAEPEPRQRVTESLEEQLPLEHAHHHSRHGNDQPRRHGTRLGAFDGADRTHIT